MTSQAMQIAKQSHANTDQRPIADRDTAVLQEAAA